MMQCLCGPHQQACYGNQPPGSLKDAVRYTFSVATDSIHTSWVCNENWATFFQQVQVPGLNRTKGSWGQEAFACNSSRWVDMKMKCEHHIRGLGPYTVQNHHLISCSTLFSWDLNEVLAYSIPLFKSICCFCQGTGKMLYFQLVKQKHCFPFINECSKIFLFSHSFKSFRNCLWVVSFRY